jgi:aspartate carbamoyltransferase catalytic subunit
MKHILRSQQFDRIYLEELFSKTIKIQKLFKDVKKRQDLKEFLKNKTMFTIFYEPSTRTRISFSAAAIHLGMEVVATENARDFSSAIKGETLKDSIKVLCEYFPDVIVLRHHEVGAAEEASLISEDYGIPIINAGDGNGQHPTQALLDLFTIQEELGQIDNLTIVFGGDLANGRTVRSLAYLLAKFSNIKLTFVSPKDLEMNSDILDYLAKHKMCYETETSLEKAFKAADVVYWTRIQKERLKDSSIYPRVASQYQIGKNELAYLHDNAILLHPLPRVNEIKTEVDFDPRAKYFKQAGNGMFIRMALLLELLQ